MRRVDAVGRACLVRAAWILSALALSTPGLAQGDGAGAAARSAGEPAADLEASFGDISVMFTLDVAEEVLRLSAIPAEERRRAYEARRNPPEPEPDPEPREARAPSEPTPQNRTEEAVDLKNVYLGALFYLGEARWSFWLNGERVGPEAVPEEYTVQAVERDRVRLTWQPKGVPDSFTFTLRPRQTFVPETRSVVEGRAPEVVTEDGEETGGNG